MRRTRKPNDVYLDYRDENCGVCEVAAETGCELGRDGTCMFWPAGSVYIRAADTHHLFSVSGQRLHVWSNLICSARNLHDKGHFGCEDQAGETVRMLSLLSKCRKRSRIGDPSEFTIAEIERCCGKSIVGWAECFHSDDPRMMEFAAELVERLRKIRAEDDFREGLVNGLVDR